MVNKKVCVVTGSRSEYGLIRLLMQDIQKSESLELQIVVTGMHLSPEFGYTEQEIKKDGFHINKRVEMLLSSDTATGIAKSTGLGIIGFADAFSDLNPDIFVVLGDRFESFSAAVTALFYKIPVAHIHGGETTEGAFDEALRHSITKMSYLHFVSTEEYRRRVIQLGENPERVYNVGALGCQVIKDLPLMSKTELEADVNFKFGNRNLLVTYHPETLQDKSPAEQFEMLLNALVAFPDVNIIFTYPNADTNGRILITMINDFCNRHPNAMAVPSLGSVRYLSFVKYVDGVIGNSSSAIIELPSFKKGAVNIGNRQKGRVIASNIINCQPDKVEIINAIKKLFSLDFRNSLQNIVNPYEKRDTAKAITSILESFPINKSLAKPFYDLKQNSFPE